MNKQDGIEIKYGFAEFVIKNFRKQNRQTIDLILSLQMFAKLSD